ncbi:fimbrial protein [Serratia sp. NA_112.1]|uniref:fimbrial protein n=1 Tax=unclassified Serratia (in: enterobacteria) TaxID=2647522 RepID=UPI0040469ABD
MYKLFIITIVFGLYANSALAKCSGPNTVLLDLPNISVDLSDKLNERNKTWTQQTFLNFPANPTFTCNSYGNKFRYYFKKTGDIGFENGKHWIKIDISVKEYSDSIKSGEYAPSILNTPATITYTLVTAGKNTDKVPGNTANYTEAVIVSDATGLSMWATAWKYLVWAGKFFRGWTYDQSDMFRQAITITYAPKMTTCSFNNAGLMVNLPKTGIAQLKQNPQPGYTPFTLNFSCENLQSNGSTDRAIDMFLSSNNLLPSDNSVLMDSTPGSAKGVGIKVAKRETPNAPVVFSTSTLNRGSATSIFSAATDTVVNSNFSVGMGAYYFPYNPAQLTSGEIRATATLNIVYQ